MNTIKYLFIILITAFCFSCEKVDIEDVPEFDNTTIISFKAYDTNKANITVGDPVIDAIAGTVKVTIKEGTSLSNIFTSCGLSSGANITPALGKYEDWSARTRTFTVTSASGKRSQQWTIILQ